MSLSNYLTELDSLARDAEAAFSSAGDAAAVEAARVEFLGAKSGRLKAAQKGLGAVEKADKPAAGKRFHEVKQAIETAHESAVARLAAVARPAAVAQAFDPTVPGVPRRLGRLHPITQTIDELKEIMGRLGFTAVEGPEVEDPWHNFDALNIPLAHPARDPLENFYLEQDGTKSGRGGEGEKRRQGEEDRVGISHSPALPLSHSSFLLRSQTSTVQIRVMEKMKPPVRIISCGRVYRPDTADASHFPMFHQIEGLLIDRGVTMADLKSTLRLFARSAFDPDVHIRFRPSFFPFTEPSVEVDMSWQDGWMELGGAGMVDPNVLRAVGYDPEEYTGFAFGLGIDRTCARRHRITDIRELFKNDVRFLHQF